MCNNHRGEDNDHVIKCEFSRNAWSSLKPLASVVRVPHRTHVFFIRPVCEHCFLKAKVKYYWANVVLWKLFEALKRNCRFHEGKSKNVSEVDNLDLFPASR